jgi:post-segregation antitoxin (ccd killing protein)
MSLERYGDDWVPRTIRVPRELWEAAREIAVTNDDNVSRVVRAALVTYVDKAERKRRQEEAPPKRSR